MPSWTNVSKPTGASYTNVAKPTGASYTNQAKPSGGGLIRAGMYMGPLGLTYNIQRDVSPWTLIHKPE